MFNFGLFDNTGGMFLNACGASLENIDAFINQGGGSVANFQGFVFPGPAWIGVPHVDVPACTNEAPEIPVDQLAQLI